MTLLAWQRGGATGGPAVVLVHGWGSDGRSDWQDTGWVTGMERAGFAVLVPDLPGHGESADVSVPGRAEPAAWAAGAILADLERLGATAFAAVGFAEGCLVAGHLAVRAPDRPGAASGGRRSTGARLRRLVLVGWDDRAGLPHGGEVAAALRDPSARLWHPEAAEAMGWARRDRRHHLPTLADWAERAAWPAAARLGALRTPVLLAVGTDDPHRARAPRMARLFHDGRLVTVPGDQRGALGAGRLVDAVAAFLSEGSEGSEGEPGPRR